MNKCPVCGVTDSYLVRTCQLRAVIPACLGTAQLDDVPANLRRGDERVAEDGE